MLFPSYTFQERSYLLYKFSYLTYDDYDYRYVANSAEDAKSEMMKLFQESWERDNGFFYTDTLPPVTKYAEDILRQKKTSTA